MSDALSAERIVRIEPANGQLPRLEIYCAGEDEARALARRFGGRFRVLPDARWQPLPATERGRPLAMGPGLLVTAWPDELAALRARHPGKQTLCIPAAMAFGTGEHATTAMCLRLLADVARRRRGEPWDLLDLGTGSGILALGGSLLGASFAHGVDNDRQAVRTAKENARLNGLPAKAVRFDRVELEKGLAPRRWAVLTANLFSELLIRLLPGVIAPALADGGDLILSGVLANQTEEVTTAIARARLRLIAVKTRGRWRGLHCRR